MDNQERKIPKPRPHAKLIHAWADGKTVQIRLKEPQEEWKDLPDSGLPLFNDKHFEYRIKPEETSNEPWKPANGIKYYYVTDLGFVYSAIWQSRHIDNSRYGFNNCFRTMEEAEAAIPRVKAALKGVFATDNNVHANVDIEKLKVWITENDIAGGLQLSVGELKERFRKLSKENEQLKLKISALKRTNFQLDGKPLSDGEKALIRAFRNGRLCHQFSYGSSLIVEGHDNIPCGVTTHRSFVAFFMYSPMQDGEVRNALEKIKSEQEASGEA